MNANELSDKSENVSAPNEQIEKKACALCGFGSPCLDDVERP